MKTMWISAVLSSLLIAAHFIRAGLWLFAVAGLGIIALLCVRKNTARLVAQWLLAASAAEWLRTLAQIVTGRMAEGRPWTLAAVIIAAVMALTILAALSLSTARAKEYFSRSGYARA